ncbi:MAG: proteasome assembly chaperone family protein [Candidatus Bathyarchaeia archaeon]
MKAVVKLYREPSVSNPVLIGGLPGIAYVAKLSTDYLINELRAELFGEIYSPFFPPYVLIKKDGTVELMKNELYCWSDRNLERGAVIYTGNTQATSPEGQYAIAEEVLNLAERFGVKRVFTLAAYVTERSAEKPRVYIAATDPKLVDEMKVYGAKPMEEGSIGGTNGLLFGLAKLRGMEGICLLGETVGYTTPTGQSLVDAKAAKAILEVLTKILGLKIDMAPLESQAKATAEIIQKIEEVERQAIEEATRIAPPKDRMLYI